MKRPGSRRSYLPREKSWDDTKRKNVNKIHRTIRWTKLSLAYRKDNPICEIHKHYGKVEAAKDTDHVIRIHDHGAPYDKANLMAICKECHAIKTGKEQHELNIDYELNDNNERIPTDKGRAQVLEMFKNYFDYETN